MSRQEKGVNLALSPARRIVTEIMHHARRVPLLPNSRVMQLAPLAKARIAHAQPPCWTALFLKAYGLACQRVRGLRRAYLPYPWPHLYEHPCSIAVVMIERAWNGEHAVLPAKIRAPERYPLAALDARLKRLQAAPLESISDFRQLMRLGRLPGFVRRFAFWQTLYWSGAKRAKRFGTFTLSSVGSFGVDQGCPLTPLTSYLSFGPIDSSGEVVVRLIYDHRVLDSRDAARGLVAMDEAFHHDVLAELNDPGRPETRLARAG